MHEHGLRVRQRRRARAGQSAPRQQPCRRRCGASGTVACSVAVLPAQCSAVSFRSAAAIQTSVHPVRMSARRRSLSGAVARLLAVLCVTAGCAAAQQGQQQDRPYSRIRSSRTNHIPYPSVSGLRRRCDSELRPLETRIDNLDSQVEALDSRIESRVEALDSRIESRIGRPRQPTRVTVDDLDRRVEALDNRLEYRVHDLDRRVEALDKRLESQVEALDKKTRVTGGSSRQPNRVTGGWSRQRIGTSRLACA